MAQSQPQAAGKAGDHQGPQDETNQLKFRFEYDVEPWNELVLLKNLTIKIGDRTLLEPFTYTVCRGQRLIIAGPNRRRQIHPAQNFIPHYRPHRGRDPAARAGGFHAGSGHRL